MEIKTVSIIGLGALGILFGDHLTRRMPEGNLRIIADSERIRRYRENGIFSNGKRCEFHFVTPDEAFEPSDLVLFSVKYNGLKDAIGAVRNQIGPQTLIMSVLNGITSEAVIGQVYGMENILYCVAQGMDATHVGNRLNYGNMGMLIFGDRKPGIVSEKTKAVSDFFKRVDLPHEIELNMQRKLWSKFMLNVGVNQAVAVFESDYAEVQKEGPARETMIAAMKEVMVLARKEGVDLSEDDIRYWLDVIGKLSPEYKPSTRQDLEARRHSEVDLFAGTVIDLGKKHGIPTPVNQQLYDRIKFLESMF